MSTVPNMFQMIDFLVAHYGSKEVLQDEISKLWHDGNGNRTMLKSDAIHKLYKEAQNERTTN